jgi:hypothetical protein
MNDRLQQDQIDIAARLAADDGFAAIPVLIQRKGVTESDIELALSTLNEKSGRMGALAVVLMPTLEPESPESPGPRYRILATIQVIEQPLFNLGATGTGYSAETIAERVRQLLHHCNLGRGSVWTFAGMEPIEMEGGKIAYGVRFGRLAGDGFGDRLPAPTITSSGSGPVMATLSCADAAAELWYTLDGSYPWSGNPQTTLYSDPIAIAEPATLRAIAYRAACQASNTATATIS